MTNYLNDKNGPSSPVSNDTLAMMQFQSNAKSTGIAYLLLFFFGTLGVHRYYLGKIGIGVLMTVCFIAGLFLLVPLIVPAVIALYDLFTLPSQVRAYNADLMNRLATGK